MTKKYAPKFARKDAGKPRTYNGLVVKDATATAMLDVIAQDHKGAKRNNGDWCVAANALDRQFPGCKAHVYRGIVLIEDPIKKVVTRYKTSAGLRDQQIIYDASGQFANGQYALLAIPAGIRSSRGKQHSPPDRKRGNPNSDKRRNVVRLGTGRHHLGRPTFHWHAESKAA